MAAGNETTEEKLLRVLRASGRMNEAIGMALQRATKASAKERRLLDEALDDFLRRQGALTGEIVLFVQSN